MFKAYIIREGNYTSLIITPRKGVNHPVLSLNDPIKKWNENNTETEQRDDSDWYNLMKKWANAKSTMVHTGFDRSTL